MVLWISPLFCGLCNLTFVETFLLSLSFSVPMSVDAIMTIKVEYEVKKNWMGDPCFPAGLAWDGVKCRTTSDNITRIISMWVFFFLRNYVSIVGLQELTCTIINFVSVLRSNCYAATSPTATCMGWYLPTSHCSRHLSICKRTWNFLCFLLLASIFFIWNEWGSPICY